MERQYERRQARNAELTQTIDNILMCLQNFGEATARGMLAAHGVPTTIGARILFHPEQRRSFLHPSEPLPRRPSLAIP